MKLDCKIKLETTSPSCTACQIKQGNEDTFKYLVWYSKIFSLIFWHILVDIGILEYYGGWGQEFQSYYVDNPRYCGNKISLVRCYLLFFEIFYMIHWNIFFDKCLEGGCIDWQIDSSAVFIVNHNVHSF